MIRAIISLKKQTTFFSLCHANSFIDLATVVNVGRRC